MSGHVEAARLISPSARIAGLARRAPVTIALALVVLMGALCLGSPPGPDAVVGTGFRALAIDGRWWTPLTSVLFTTDPVELVVALVAVLLVVGAAERLMGSWRTLVAFFATSATGVVVGVTLQSVGVRVGELWSHSVIEYTTMDVFTGVAGTIATASAFAPALHRRRIRVLTVLVVVVFLLYSGQPSDLYRLMAVGAGLTLGQLLRHGDAPVGWVRSSHRETRVFFAAATAALAVGPTVAVIMGTRLGPLGPVTMLLEGDVGQQPGDAVCTAMQLTRRCVREIAVERLSGPAPLATAILPLVVLLVAAYGLLRGRRFGVWLAVAVNAFTAALAALYFGFLPAIGAVPVRPHPPGHYAEVVAALSMSVLVPAALAVLLVVERHHFAIMPSRRTIARLLAALGVVAAVLVGAYIAVTVVVPGGFIGHVGLAAALADLPERIVPVSFLHRVPERLVPVGPAATVIYGGVGAAFWVAAAIAAAVGVFSVSPRMSQGSAARARRLLVEGGGSLSFMTTWKGNSYWFDERLRAAIAFRVVGAVAVTIGGPIGRDRARPEVLGGFARYCDDHGWTPVFYSVAPEDVETLRELGWSAAVVAEESLIRPAQWSTTGKRWQDVRSSVNRAERLGITAVWTSWAELPRATAAQVAALSAQWVSERRMAELDFLLGGLDELRDPAVRLMLAVGDDGVVQAVTSWLPWYEGGEVRGWTLDFMRRRTDGPNGIMEFTIASVAERLRDTGVESMSLSAAPLAQRPDGDDGGALADALGRIRSSLESVYGFGSLFAFKKKFHPEFAALSMAYPDPVALPAIGIALLRLYLPGMSVRDMLRMRPRRA